ncbi:MAG: type II secretion system minor pseudopilin GspI [Rhodospirillaceae bacterium]|jgi:general secretion pathway protein I
MSDKPLRNITRQTSHLQSGFTLIEVIVALGIFGMAVVSLIHMQGESTKSALALRDRAIAGIVAENVLIDLYTRADELPNGGNSGQTDMAGQTWQWSSSIGETPNPLVRQLDVDVRLAGAALVLSSRTGFKGTP